MDQQAVVGQFGSVYSDGLVIPDIVVTSLILDSAEFRLIGEGHLNFQLAREFLIPFFFLALVCIVKAKIPSSIEVYPVVADKLRSRIIFLITFHILVLHHGYSFIFSDLPLQIGKDRQKHKVEYIGIFICPVFELTSGHGKDQKIAHKKII